MELMVQTAVTFDDTEIYQTYTYCPNINGFPGFLRMIMHVKTVNSRPFLSSHAHWVRVYVHICMNTTQVGEDNPKKDYQISMCGSPG